MPTPEDDFFNLINKPTIEQPAKLPAPDDDFFDLIKDDPITSQAKSNLNVTRDLDPDKEAEYYDLAKRSTLPVSTVRLVPEEVKRNLEYPIKIISRSERFKRYFAARHSNAAISRDDVDNLSNVENVIDTSKSTLDRLLTESPTVGGVAQTAAAATALGISEIPKSLGNLFDFVAPLIVDKRKLDFAEKNLQPITLSSDMQEWLRGKYGDTKAEELVGSSFESLGTMAAFFVTGGESAILPGISAVSGIGKTTEAMAGGADRSTAITAGIFQAATEYLTEKIPLDILRTPATSFIKKLAQGVIFDVPGELASTANEMWLIDQGILGGEHKTKDEYKQALIDTAFVSMITTTAATAPTHAVQKALGQVDTANSRAVDTKAKELDQNKAFHDSMTSEREAIGKTLTAERSRDHMKEFINTVDGDKDVYISSEGIDKLYQSHTEEEAAKFLTDIGIEPTAAQATIISGEDTTVKINDIRTMPEQDYNKISDDIKPAPGAYTQREIQEDKANEDVENLVKLVAEDVKKTKVIDSEIARIQEEGKAAGLSQDTIETTPVLIRGIANKLELEGLDTAEFLNKISFKKEKFMESIADKVKKVFQGKRDPVQLPKELKTSAPGDVSDDLFGSLEHMQALELKLRAYGVVPEQDSTVELFKEETREELDLLTDDIKEHVGQGYDDWLAIHETPEGWVSGMLDIDNEMGMFSHPSEAFKGGVVGVLEGTQIWSVDIEQEILDKVNEEFAAEELPDNIDEVLEELENFGEDINELKSGIEGLDEEEALTELHDTLRDLRAENSVQFELFYEIESGSELGEILDAHGWNSEIGQVISNMMETVGYEQWKQSIGEDTINETIDRIREQRDRLENATDVNEKVVAINIAMNEQHVTGTMAERLDVSQDELDTLSSMGDTVKNLRELVSPERKRLFQAGGAKKRGAVTLDNERHTIYLFEDADMSTVLHEVGHVALKEYMNIEQIGKASDSLKKDMTTLREWVGLEEGAAFEVPHMEQVARGFEAYLMEGKAPTKGLAAAFERFKNFLINTYKSAKALNVKLNPQVRQVFDRMVSTNLEVEAMAATGGFTVKTVAEMEALGMSKPDQFYATQQIDQTTKEAERRLSQARNKNYRDNITTWREESRSELREENPAYDIISSIILENPISREEFIESYGKDAISLLPDRRILKKEGEQEVVISRVDALNDIRRQISEGEVARRVPITDKEGNIIDWTVTDGTLPEFFKDKGYTKKETLTAIDKELAGKKLTARQKITVNDLVDSYKEQVERQAFTAEEDVEFPFGEFAKPTVKRTGQPLDKVAVIYGYDDSIEMISEFFDTPNFNKAVTQRVEQKVTQHDAQFQVEDYIVDLPEYRDYLNIMARYITGQTVDESVISKGIQQNIARWEKEAREQSKRIIVKLTPAELEKRITNIVQTKIDNWQAKKAKSAAISIDTLKALALDTMSAKTVKEAQRVDKYLSAMKKAANDERRAILRKDWGAASEANETARFNYELAGLSVKVRDEVDTIQKRAKRISKTKTVDYTHKEAILHLVSRYNVASVAPSDPATTPDYNTLFAGDDYNNDGYQVPQFLLDNSIDDFRDLRVEQLRELDNAIRYLEGQGRIDAKKYLSDGETELQGVVDESVEVQNTVKPKKVWEKGSMMRRLSDPIRKAFSWIDSLTYESKRLDGYTNLGKDGVKGPVERHVIDPIKQAHNDLIVAGTEIKTLTEPALNQIGERIRAWNKKFKGSIQIEGVPVPAAMRADGQTKGWRAQQIFAIALNTGNKGEASNYENLLSGYPDLTAGMIEQINNMLTVEDMQAVQGIWDAMDSLFSKVDAQHLKIKNYHMPKVQATPFTFKGREFKGGYYPIKHDRALSYKVADRGLVDDLFESDAAAFSVPYTKSGATIQRQSGVALPILLDLSVIDSHFRDTLQYIHFSDAIRDADRITRSPEFREAAIRILGKDVYETIRPALKHIANPKRAGLDVAGAQAVEKMRGLSTAYVLAWNTGVAIKQPLSTFGAIRDMGAKAYVSGFSSILLSPSAHYQKMIDLSPYMKDRLTSFDRELKSQFLKLSGEQRSVHFNDSNVTWQDVKNFGFWQIRIADTVTVLPIWHGAFNDKLLSDQSNLQEAINYADDIVRNSQPSAQPLDLSSWQRDSGVIRLFSQFQTFTVGKYGQRQRLFYNAWRNGKISNVDYAWFNAMDAVVPLVAINLLQSLLWGSDLGDEEEQQELMFDVLQSWAFMGVPIVSQVARSVFRYGDPFDSPVLETANKAVRGVVSGAKGLDGFENKKDREKSLWAIAHTFSILMGVPVSKIVERALKGAKQKKGVPGVKLLVPAPRNKQ